MGIQNFWHEFQRAAAYGKIIRRRARRAADDWQDDYEDVMPGDLRLKKDAVLFTALNEDQGRAYLRNLGRRRLVARTNRSIMRLQRARLQAIASSEASAFDKLTGTEVVIVRRCQNSISRAITLLERRRDRLLKELEYEHHHWRWALAI